MTDLRLTTLAAEAWVQSQAVTRLQTLQFTAQAWISSNSTQIQQWNPVFPVKPGNGHGGGGPPGQAGGGSGGPGNNKTPKIGGALGDVVIDYDTDNGYPAYLVTTTGATYFAFGPTIVNLTGLSTAQAWLRSSPALSLSTNGRSMALSFDRAAPSLSVSIAGSSSSITEGKGSLSGLGTFAGRSFSSSAGKATPALQAQLAGALLSAMFAQASFGQSTVMAGRLFAMATSSAGASLKTAIAGKSFSSSSSKAFGFGTFIAGASFAMAAARGMLDRTGKFAGRSMAMAAGRAQATLALSIDGLSTSIVTAFAGLRLYPVLDATGRYVAHLLIENLLKDDQPGSYITRWEGDTSYVSTWPDETYVAGLSDVYITTWAGRDPLCYIASTEVTNMPEAEQLPPIDAIVQAQTITLDFGKGSYIPAGVTLTGTPTCQLAVEWGDDADPASRILVPPQIGTAPKPYGSGRTNTAVLVQIGNLPPSSPVGYILKCWCTRTDGDVASMDVRFDSRIPGGTP